MCSRRGRRCTVVESVCELGYPVEQLVEILGERLPEFDRWMDGQTRAICDGRRYDRGNCCYVASGCGPHGVVTYSHAVQRFLWDLPVID